MIEGGRLFLAQPPLFRVAHGGKSIYAKDDADLQRVLESEFKNKKPEIGRFKGLGEMNPAQLKDTTMNPATRTLNRVSLPNGPGEITDLVETLMGKRAELRFKFIQDNAKFVDEIDV
jgi:topoisomerase-4 subunit B